MRSINTTSFVRFACVVIACVIPMTAAATTVQVNFSTDSGLTTWNDITTPTTDIANLLEDDGSTLSGWAFTTDDTDRFNSSNTSGTSTPGAPASLTFPGSVTTAAFYGNTLTFGSGIYATTRLYFDNLDPTATYDFIIFGARAASADNREGLYTAIGSNTGSAELDIDGNTSMIAEIMGISPDGSNRIELQIVEGDDNTSSAGFYYLSGLTLTEIEAPVVPEPSSLLLLGLGALGLVRHTRRRRRGA